MALINMRDMLFHAYRNGYAVGSFNVINLDFITATISAAERCQAPVILNISESHLDYFDLDIIMPAVEAAAHNTAVPVAIHFDRGTSLNAAIHAIRSGCNSVALDTPHSLQDNIQLATSIATMAHTCGIPIEGSILLDEHNQAVIESVITYVAKAGVDSLALSINAANKDTQSRTITNFDDLAKINKTLQIPLVIYNGTECNNEQLNKLISNGVSKINFYTSLANAACSTIHNNVIAGNDRNYTNLIGGVQDAISAEVERCIRLTRSSHRANDLITHCRPWQEVEHLIIYNVASESRQETDAMISEGKRVLSDIPGVRKVITGYAIRQDAQYQFTWLVRFCHPAVIDSYRDHPAHTAFANNLFRPVAANRISIDFQLT